MHRNHLVAASLRHDRRPPSPYVWKMTMELLGLMFVGVRPTERRSDR